MRFLQSLLLAVVLVSCTPSPQPEHVEHSNTSSPLAAAERVASVLSWVLPGIRSVAALLPIPDEAKAIVVRSAQIVERGALPAFQRVLSMLRTRNAQGPDCEFYAASGALQEGLIGVVDAAAEAGYNAPPELEDVVRSVGGLVDGFASGCVDAGLDSAGQRFELRLRAHRAAALQRGAILRAFPELPRESR